MQQLKPSIWYAYQSRYSHIHERCKHYRYNSECIYRYTKNSDFEIPVDFSYNPKKRHSENKGFLKDALKSFLNKFLNVKYSGSVTVEVLGVSLMYQWYTEEVRVGLGYE